MASLAKLDEPLPVVSFRHLDEIQGGYHEESSLKIRTRRKAFVQVSRTIFEKLDMQNGNGRFANDLVNSVH